VHRVEVRASALALSFEKGAGEKSGGSHFRFRTQGKLVLQGRSPSDFRKITKILQWIRKPHTKAQRRQEKPSTACGRNERKRNTNLPLRSSVRISEIRGFLLGCSRRPALFHGDFAPGRENSEPERPRQFPTN
jgi:hypothetical protein